MINLRDYQIECVNKILEQENGCKVCIKAPTGSGKTIIMSGLIKETYNLNYRYLIVVPSSELREQTSDKIKSVCGENVNIGFVQSTLDEVSSRIVIATRQSLTHSKSTRLNRMKEYGEFDYVIFDECLVGNTLVTMEDGGFKYIKDINNGDVVLGGKVSNKFSRVSNINKVYHSCGKIEGSPTHPTWIIPKEKMKNLNDITDEDFECVCLKDINIGDFIPNIRTINHTTKYNWTYYELSFVGLILADGHLDKEGNRIKVNVSKDFGYYETIFSRGIEDFYKHGYCDSNTYNATLDIRNNLTLFINDKKLKELLETKFLIKRGKKSNNVCISEQIQYSSLNSIKGFLASVLSCEGALVSNSDTNNSWSLTMQMTSEDFINQFILLLKKFGIVPHYLYIKRKGKNHNDNFRITLSGFNFNLFMDNFRNDIIKRKYTDFRNIGQSNLKYNEKYYFSRVTKNIYENDKTEKVYDFTTTTHSFFANGIKTHNCHQAILQQEKIINKLENGFTKFIGMSATPYNEDMKKVYSKIIFKRNILDMIELGNLVPPRCKLVYSQTDISSVKTTAGEFNLGQLEDCVNNSVRNELIVEAYKEFASNRSKTLVFATGIEHANAICKCFNDNGILAYSVDSEDTKENRDNIINMFKNNKIKVLVNVGILTTGFDLPSLDTIIICRPTKSRMLYEQIIGRGLRLFENKTDCLIIDVVDIARQHDIMSMSDVFNIDIKDGETPTEAKERIEKLEKEEQERLEQERIRKEQEELLRQQLIAEEIALFNSDMKNIINSSNLDWFRFDDITYSLLGSISKSMTIRKVDNEFKVYVGEKERYLKLEEVYITNNLHEAIEYCENILLECGTSYIKKDVRWKNDLATQNQLKYINDKMRKYVKTKWDVNKCFFNSSLYNALKFNNLL